MRSSRFAAGWILMSSVLASLLFAPRAESAGWAVGSTGTILKSVDAGVTWSGTFPSVQDFHAVDFVDDNTGWTVGTGGAIFKTTNGGTNWSLLTSGTTAILNGVTFVSTTTGWAVGTTGTILKTTNGGTSWALQTSGTTAILNSVFFLDANTGWAVGTGGVILKTVNGGTNWALQTSGSTATFNSVHFASSTTGWAVGTSGAILKTTNGGTSWALQTSGSTAILNSAFFVDANTGWVSGSGGVILKTVNGGTNWTLQTSGSTATLNSIYFLSSTIGWTVGTTGTILKTVNGGTNWALQTSGSGATLYGVHFVSIPISVTVNTSPTGRSFSVDGTNYTTAQVLSWASGSSHTIATTSPQAGAANTRYAWTSWSDAGLISHTVAPVVATTYTANFKTQYNLTMNAGTGGSVLPATGYQDAGAVVSISATPTAGHVFTSWSGSGSGSYTGSNNPGSVTMNAPITETGSFAATVSATVGTSPTGRSFSVDGTGYTSTQVFTWISGSSHTIATTSPQAGGAGTQYVWTGWSDAGALSHSVAPTGTVTYTANFKTQYQLTMSAGSGGTVGPASGFQDAASVVSISATPNAGFSFSGWSGTGSGSYTGSNNPGSITMNAPITETGSFAADAAVTIDADLAGLSFSVDGTPYTTAQVFHWAPGSMHTIATTSPQAGAAGTRYVWTDWSDGGAISHTISPSGTASYTAHFKTQYFLTTSAGPGGTVTPASDWNDAGSAVQIQATPTSGAASAFDGWSGSGAGSYTGTDNPAMITMTAAVSESASFRDVTGIEDTDGGIPAFVFLGQNRPNPVSSRTTFRFGLPRRGTITLRLYDVNGRVVATLADGEFAAGNFTRDWNARDLSGAPVASGVYFARLRVDNQTRSRRVLVVR